MMAVSALEIPCLRQFEVRVAPEATHIEYHLGLHMHNEQAETLGANEN